MSTTAEVRDLFPLRLELWPGDDRPALLHLVGEPEADAGEDDADEVKDGSTDDDEDGSNDDDDEDAAAVECVPGFLDARVTAGGREPITQEASWSKDYGLKARGRQGCITRLRRALGSLPADAWSELRRSVPIELAGSHTRAGVWTNEALLAAVSATSGGMSAAQRANNIRQLARLDAGRGRVDASLVAGLARTLGLELDDLVYTHEIAARKARLKASDKKNGLEYTPAVDPIGDLNAERRAKRLEALRTYEVELTPVRDGEALAQLACDLADPDTEKYFVPSWWQGKRASPARRWTTGVRQLRGLPVGQGASADQLMPGLRAALAEIDDDGLWVGVGRHIGVTEAPHHPFLAPLGVAVRRLHVVIAGPADRRSIVVDLLPSYHLLPTLRFERLGDGDTSLVSEIERDIAWCGHWEGRWFRFVPLDAPDWLRRAVKNRSLT